jgi:hypothetical protein
MLTSEQIEELAPRMGIPLVFCDFKNELPKKIEANKSYIINMENETNYDGELNGGSHWTCFQVSKYPNDKCEAIYFDSFGIGAPEIIKKRIRDTFGIETPYCKKDIQSLMSDACGYYCLAFLHFINECPHRSRHLHTDANTFMEMFEDLNTSVDWKKNEWILKHFFQSKDPLHRKAVDVLDDNMADTARKLREGSNTTALDVEVKYV